MSTSALQPGMTVLTSLPDGEDFGLPLVSPVHRPGRGAEMRIVRSVRKVRGGSVVRFRDGTKTRVLNGHTAWVAQPSTAQSSL